MKARATDSVRDTKPVMLEPELKMPVASDRSFFGNHSATHLMLAGNRPDWPRPSAAAAIMKPVSERASP